MQAVDHVGVDAGVQAVGVLKVALADDAVGVGRHLRHDFQGFQMAQDVQYFAAGLGAGASGELLTPAL